MLVYFRGTLTRGTTPREIMGGGRAPVSVPTKPVGAPPNNWLRCSPLRTYLKVLGVLAVKRSEPTLGRGYCLTII